MSGNGNIKLVCLDTSLFIYFFEKNPQFYLPSKIYFQKLETNSVKAVTTMLTVIEVLSFTKIGLSEEVFLEAIFSLSNLTILEVNKTIAIEAARIRREYKFSLADAVQLATALYAKAKVFITNDEPLKKFKELKVILLSELK